MKPNILPFKPKPPPVPESTRSNEVWMVDFAKLDFNGRPCVTLVVDVGTRRPLSAMLTFGIADIDVEMKRLVAWSGKPKEIWLDNSYQHRFHAALWSWAERQGISIIYVPMQMPRMKSISERLLGEMNAFLRDKRPPTIWELRRELELWRRSYTPAARTIPQGNQ